MGAHTWIGVGGVMGALGVALGAFGAHGLRPLLPLQVMTIFETAVRYHLLHVPALLACGVLMAVFPERARTARNAGVLFLAGIFLFSGSLYAMALTDIRILGAITPLGGLCWIAGWSLLAWGFLRGSRR